MFEVDGILLYLRPFSFNPYVLSVRYLMLWLLSFCGTIQIHAQSDVTVDFLSSVRHVASKQEDNADFVLQKEDNTGLLFPLYALYKYGSSMNDVPNTCKFHPTCGNYGSLAIKKYGIFLGTLKTTDRLLRCNDFHYHGQYEQDPVTQKYLDAP